MVELKPEIVEDLRTVAETLLAHKAWYESQPAGKTSLDDDSLYFMSTYYLILYALYAQGDVPEVYKAKKEDKQ